MQKNRVMIFTDHGSTLEKLNKDIDNFLVENPLYEVFNIEKIDFPATDLFETPYRTVTVELTLMEVSEKVTIKDNNVESIVSPVCKCPQCKSDNIMTERRINGDSYCIDCSYGDATKKFIDEV